MLGSVPIQVIISTVTEASLISVLLRTITLVLKNAEVVGIKNYEPLCDMK